MEKTKGSGGFLNLLGIPFPTFQARARGLLLPWCLLPGFRLPWIQAGGKQRKNVGDGVGFITDLVILRILVFFPSSCYNLIFRVLKYQFQGFCPGFITAFSGRDKIQCLLHLSRNWNSGPFHLALHHPQWSKVVASIPVLMSTFQPTWRRKRQECIPSL